MDVIAYIQPEHRAVPVQNEFRQQYGNTNVSAGKYFGLDFIVHTEPDGDPVTMTQVMEQNRRLETLVQDGTKRIEELEQIVRKLNENMETLWCAPGNPGARECQAEFEERVKLDLQSHKRKRTS